MGQPQGIGGVERLHRSLKEEVQNLEELQRLAKQFRRHYNTRRPHQALRYKTPLEIIKKSRKLVSFS